jgi:hypothetical protein
MLKQEMHVPVKVQAPVLQIHGLQDQFLLPGALNNTWEWLENDWTLPKPVTLSNMMRPNSLHGTY